MTGCRRLDNISREEYSLIFLETARLHNIVSTNQVFFGRSSSKELEEPIPAGLHPETPFGRLLELSPGCEKDLRIVAGRVPIPPRDAVQTGTDPRRSHATWLKPLKCTHRSGRVEPSCAPQPRCMQNSTSNFLAERGHPTPKGTELPPGGRSPSLPDGTDDLRHLWERRMSFGSCCGWASW